GVAENAGGDPVFVVETCGGPVFGNEAADARGGAGADDLLFFVGLVPKAGHHPGGAALVSGFDSDAVGAFPQKLGDVKTARLRPFLAGADFLAVDVGDVFVVGRHPKFGLGGDVGERDSLAEITRLVVLWFAVGVGLVPNPEGAAPGVLADVLSV